MGEESEMKLFDIGILAFYEFWKRIDCSFMVLKALFNESLTNISRSVKHTCSPDFMCDDKGFKLQRNERMHERLSQKTIKNSM